MFINAYLNEIGSLECILSAVSVQQSGQPGFLRAAWLCLYPELEVSTPHVQIIKLLCCRYYYIILIYDAKVVLNSSRKCAGTPQVFNDGQIVKSMLNPC